MSADSTPTTLKSITVKVGESITFQTGVDSQEIRLTLLHKSGQMAKLLVRAPDSTRIERPPKRSS